jgi:hypothetical protein
MSELKDELEQNFGKRWTKVFIVFAVAIALYLGSSLVFSFWPFSSAAKVVEKVTSAESIIGNYQWFYDQYNAIQAQEANVTAAAGSAEYTGMKMVLNNAIAEYNSRSKQITRNLWKAPDLPYQISLGGGK